MEWFGCKSSFSRFASLLRFLTQHQATIATDAMRATAAAAEIPPISAGDRDDEPPFEADPVASRWFVTLVA
jgi:hypothetical protein